MPSGATPFLLTPTCRATVDRRAIVDNYDLVSLAMDEIVDDGIIL